MDSSRLVTFVIRKGGGREEGGKRGHGNESNAMRKAENGMDRGNLDTSR